MLFKTFLVFISAFFVFSLKAQLVEDDKTGVFSGRLSSLNEEASLIRVKVDFTNMKYVNKKDKVEFWTDGNLSRRCIGYVLGKSHDYFLIKVPEFKKCQFVSFLGYGAYLNFQSKDLYNNILVGKELIEVLNKKYTALTGQLENHRKLLDTHLEKVESVNKRYELLKEKLEKEWREEIQYLEEDRNVALRNYKGTQIRLDEVKQKLEKYRIEDENLKLDRWALDSHLYYKK